MPVAPAPAPADDDDDNVYDLMKDFGAAGDGVTDDTDAVKTAWDTACQAGGDGVVVATAGHEFLVHSTIFTGPCNGSVTLQVIALLNTTGNSFVPIVRAGTLLIRKSDFRSNNMYCLQIDGTIVAPSDPTTWPANSKRNWLVFYKADGVSLTGAGLIDGKGQKWWDLPCKPHKVRRYEFSAAESQLAASI